MGLRFLLALAVVAITSPLSAVAQEAPPRPSIDGEDPCIHEGLPAISPSGRRIAWVSCWSDLSAALDARFVVADASTGRVLSEIVLARRPTGGEGGTGPAAVRRRVERANRALATGRFAPMLRVEGLSVGVDEARAGDVVVRIDAGRRLLLVQDAASGHERGRARLPESQRNPYCCGGDPDDVTPCSLPPEAQGAWMDEQSTVILAEIVSGSGAPDGCEGGPDFVLASARARP